VVTQSGLVESGGCKSRRVPAAALTQDQLSSIRDVLSAQSLLPTIGEPRRRPVKMTGAGDEDDVDKPPTFDSLLVISHMAMDPYNEKCAAMEGGRSQPGQDVTDPRASIDDNLTPTSR